MAIGARRDPAPLSGVQRFAGAVILTGVPMVSSVLGIVAFGVSWVVVAFTLLCSVLAVSVYANVQLLRSLRADDGVTTIAFISPSAENQYFYTTLLMGLIRSANSTVGTTYAVVPSVPSQSFEEVSIWTLFDDVERRAKAIDAVVFVPDDPDKHFDEIVAFVAEHPKVPLVLVDVYFDISKADERTMARLPPFVGGDEQQGGTLAAEMLAESIGPASDGTVLVLLGGEAPWENGRVRAFATRLGQLVPAMRLETSEWLYYDREAACRWLTSHFRASVSDKRVVGVPGIFAADDETAIGARQAILALEAQGYSFDPVPQVVGYDGIPEMIQYLESSDRIMAGTVDVRISDQASMTMALVHRMLSRGQKVERLNLVPPRPIRRTRL